MRSSVVRTSALQLGRLPITGGDHHGTGERRRRARSNAGLVTASASGSAAGPTIITGHGARLAT